jgi:hypothetical protein
LAAAPAPALDVLPGFRRRFRVTPGPGRVRTEVEDDYHCMAVTLHHAGGVVTRVEAEQDRAPWSTCPGATAKVEQTFTGMALDAFPARGEKTANCTHLYDLALLAAAHAGDAQPLVYDILACDPEDGHRRLELRRDGVALLSWAEQDGRFVAPAELAGLSLRDMRRYVDALTPELQEAARLLRWAGFIAHGRQIPMSQQSDAARMPPNCYTFQPEMAAKARRVGEIREFSAGAAQPLDRRPAPVAATARP